MRIALALTSTFFLSACSAAPINLSHTLAEPRTLEFHIAAGTGSNSWNSPSDMLLVTVGDTLHIVNDDGIHHRLHTTGKPCPHGPEILPGGAFDCLILRAFDPEASGALYDHYAGPGAAFWLKAESVEQRHLNF